MAFFLLLAILGSNIFAIFGLRPACRFLACPPVASLGALPWLSFLSCGEPHVYVGGDACTSGHCFSPVHFGWHLPALQRFVLVRACTTTLVGKVKR